MSASLIPLVALTQGETTRDRWGERKRERDGEREERDGEETEREEREREKERKIQKTLFLSVFLSCVYCCLSLAWLFVLVIFFFFPSSVSFRLKLLPQVVKILFCFVLKVFLVGFDLYKGGKNICYFICRSVICFAIIRLSLSLTLSLTLSLCPSLSFSLSLSLSLCLSLSVSPHLSLSHSLSHPYSTHIAAPPPPPFFLFLSTSMRFCFLYSISVYISSFLYV